MRSKERVGMEDVSDGFSSALVLVLMLVLASVLWLKSCGKRFVYCVSHESRDIVVFAMPYGEVQMG